MANFNEDVSNLVLRLYEIEAVKFGNFKMKIGANSPVYFDLRVIVSHPSIMKKISDLLYDFSIRNIKCDHLCGVPYTALPIASIISANNEIPMLIRRKETKDYGTKKLIEGQFKEGDKCIIIEDVITSGSSVLETAKDLRAHGLEVTDAVVLLNRQQGGEQILSEGNIKVKSLFTMTELIRILVKAGKIEPTIEKMVEEYLKSSQFHSSDLKKPNERLITSFESRQHMASNPVAKNLFKLMCEKRTNLCVAADLTSSSKILDLFVKVAPYICIFKTHIDIVEDYTDEFINKLTSLAKEQNVVLMEDRKFGDIGNTVALQYTSGIYKIANWADLVTVHASPGPGVIKGIKNNMANRERGIFLVIEMSSEGNLLTSQYREAAMKMVLDESETVAGIVCQSRDVLSSPGIIQLTPGVQLNASKDGLGQNYNSPEDVVIKRGADIAVVGRGIIVSEDPAKEAKIYRDKLWEAYEKRISNK
ncbi:rudimentary-like isoform X1 [Arctopsyche grandis]|uniref:rudimentary-like isoform X1 n=1 Tax=Arctopsyche grandis TaxID=121162 RepID=UPI00406D9333